MYFFLVCFSSSFFLFVCSVVLFGSFLFVVMYDMSFDSEIVASRKLSQSKLRSVFRVRAVSLRLEVSIENGARFEDSFYKPLDRSGFGKGPVPTATRAWFYAPWSPRCWKDWKLVVDD